MNVAKISKYINKTLLFTIVLICIFTSTLVFAGNTLVATHDSDNYIPGSHLTVTNNIEYTGSVTALGIKATLPHGWSFLTVTSAYEPEIKPKVDTMETLEFAWITLPESPFTFTYTVLVPENESGEKQITSVVLYRRLGEELRESVTPNPLILIAE